MIKAYLFDVDGVLTNPEAKRVEEEALFDELIKRLVGGEPIGLNTGRSLEFMIEKILDPLESRVKGRHLLQNIFAVGEKGAAWITYDENDARNVYVDTLISVPQEVQDEVRELMKQSPYKEVMFYDETKQTMVSTELLHGKTVAEFQEPQKQLEVVLRKLLARHGLQDTFRVDPTRIATDVENIHVGKALGAKRFIELLQARNINPTEYIGFGDSKSDYAMLEELQRLGKKSVLVYVGSKKDLEGENVENVIFTKSPVDHGTLEYLQSL